MVTFKMNNLGSINMSQTTVIRIMFLMHQHFQTNNLNINLPKK